MLCVLFICVFLWEKDCWILAVGSFFSHRAHRVHWAFRRTFRTHRRPPAYRYHRALLLFSILIRDNVKPTSFFIGVSRWSRPFPSGEGTGEGPAVVGKGASCCWRGDHLLLGKGPAVVGEGQASSVDLCIFKLNTWRAIFYRILMVWWVLVKDNGFFYYRKEISLKP